MESTRTHSTNPQPCSSAALRTVCCCKLPRGRRRRRCCWSDLWHATTTLAATGPWQLQHAARCRHVLATDTGCAFFNPTASHGWYVATVPAPSTAAFRKPTNTPGCHLSHPWSATHQAAPTVFGVMWPSTETTTSAAGPGRYQVLARLFVLCLQ